MAEAHRVDTPGVSRDGHEGIMQFGISQALSMARCLSDVGHVDRSLNRDVIGTDDGVPVTEHVSERLSLRVFPPGVVESPSENLYPRKSHARGMELHL